MVIKVMDYVEKCYSNSDGEIIFNIINKAFKESNKIIVSFEGVTSLNSSFVNSAFIELLDKYDFSIIQEKIQFKDSTSQINRIIKERFNFEVSRKELAFA